MSVRSVTLNLIGSLHTPHRAVENMPIQPTGACEVEGIAELFPEYTDGLRDLDGFSHVILLYHLHEVKEHRLSVKPFMDTVTHGVFATRSPCRPAPIGLSIVQVKDVTANQLIFTGADMLDGSPLIDIKPYFRQVDAKLDAVSGWLESKQGDLPANKRSDRRFLFNDE